MSVKFILNCIHYYMVEWVCMHGVHLEDRGQICGVDKGCQKINLSFIIVKNPCTNTTRQNGESEQSQQSLLMLPPCLPHSKGPLIPQLHLFFPSHPFPMKTQPLGQKHSFQLASRQNSCNMRLLLSYLDMASRDGTQVIKFFPELPELAELSPCPMY